uniref:Carbamoyl phosphate synthase small chain n=1 Tax=Ahnfeltia plicata TaxID=28023 RepID=A0A1C9CB73_9FLOR|nr:carbamoyl-phosphate synthase arginine-specific small subunit [Ahnfeltia plicata]AOM65604.1 carbamoyl-phosphate synthase arginine-specific small subunit [Ahnfeltia plicata]UAT97141.1 carbamoyl-phosphate synthase arginine-specific small subunit [Ahnfeltia plicata]UAT97346.1 carbamoyl-phosphate synthase arginine-specific small subunit [Ahnfeltia plicata]
MIQTYPTKLLLEDGTQYKGWSLNNSMISIGEVVFNTGMTGYQEIMTDPSYSGQIVAFTYPELGNTGINNEDSESDQVHVKGIIAKNICFFPSNWRNKLSLAEYLQQNNIIHIFGIDTRALTKHLRNSGAMNGCISSSILDTGILQKRLKLSPTMVGLDLVKEVTTLNSYTWIPNQPAIYSHIRYKTNKFNKKSLTIVVVDFGVKHNILNRLYHHGCSVQVVPAISNSASILKYKPDGILLSNGPGDPSVVTYGIATVQELLKTNVPIFGICMGHQVLSLALGAKTFKLKFGHRGLNHPVGLNKRVEITSQNHGFAVKATSLSNEIVQITHLNFNDITIAGIVHKHKPIFSVQYHPEANPGPHDSDYLFTHFIKVAEMIKLAQT